MGSDMSRAKFDFSGYDADKQRRKKAPSPERKVVVKATEDMEVFTTDHGDQKLETDLDAKNADKAEKARQRVEDMMFGGGTPEKMVEAASIKKSIKNEPI